MFALLQVRWPVCFVLVCLSFNNGTHQARAQHETSETTLAPDDRAAHLIVFRFSEELLTKQLNGRTDRLLPVRDVILNTPVSGTARLVAEPKVELQPCEDQARFKVIYAGTIASRTVGRNGPATIHSRSVTRFTATQNVVFQPGQGFSAVGPSEVQAQTQCFTDGIQINRGGILGRIIQRKAEEQVAASKPTVTAIARQRAMHRITQVFEKHMEKKLAKLNEKVEFQTRLAELRTGDGHRRLIARTTSDYLEIADAIFVDNAPIGQPDLTGISQGAGPLQIWVHSSIVPPTVGQALETIFMSPDESAVLNAMSLLPGTLSKQSAAALTAFASENKVGIQNTGEWLVVEINSDNTSRVAAAPTGSTRR